MKKSLVLAEKPSVGRDIARVLGCKQGGNGYLEGSKYIVTWAMGHLVELATPEKYDKKLEHWRMEDLPILPGGLRKVVIRRTSKQFNLVKKLLHRDNVETVIIATDAGREGELVARWILAQAKVKKPIKRLWISSVTDKAIKQGFQNLKDGRQYNNLFAAAEARAEADWIVGINATRALTCKYNAQLSCGRVQTPTLSMIGKREEEIRSFVPKLYYGLQVTAGGQKWTWRDQNNNARSFSKDKVDQVKKSIAGKELLIEQVSQKEKKTHSQSLYDLTSLQQDANKRYGYSAKQTLSIMQRLYEQHKLLTYPRTDSRYLTSDIVETIPERLQSVAVGPYTKYASRLQRKTVRAGKHFVNDSKVTDHHAIIPTEERVYLSTLSDEERRIYDLVVRRFLAVLTDAHVYMETKVTGRIEKASFHAQGKRIIKMGWKDIYSGDAIDEDEEYFSSDMPAFEKGQKLSVGTVKETSGKTQPPARFTEATLLAAMENPAKYMRQADQELKKILNETGGIGTVATRADIIEKLYNTFYIEKRDQYLHITSKGKQLLELAPEELRSPELTAEWEKRLTAISNGKEQKRDFVDEMRTYTKKAVNDIQRSAKTFKHDNVTRTKCPDCGKMLLEVKGKRGKMLVCPDRECGYRKKLSVSTNARCPNCHKRMELKGEGDGRLFVCRCGYKEKLSAFENRKKKTKNKASSRDVQKYLKQEKSDEPFNNPFADALKGWKKD